MTSEGGGGGGEEGNMGCGIEVGGSSNRRGGGQEGATDQTWA